MQASARADQPQFSGQVSNADPADIPAGALAALDNWQPLIPGRLSGRKGMVPVTYSNTPGATATADVIAMGVMRMGSQELLVYENDAGELCLGKNPA